MDGMIPVYAWIIQSIEEIDNVLLNGGKIIIISETMPPYLNSPQFGSSCMSLTDLLPNYDALNAYIDGPREEFVNRYIAMLESPACSVYFATILAAIVNSIPLGIVFGTEEIEVEAATILLNYIANKFGIHFGHHYPFMNEPPMQIGYMAREYVGVNIEYLYMYDMITPNELLTIYPIDIPFSYNAIMKLIADVKPLVYNPEDINSYIAYFNEVRKLMSMAKKPLTDPLER